MLWGQCKIQMGQSYDKIEQYVGVIATVYHLRGRRDSGCPHKCYKDGLVTLW